ncbi:MAG: pyridoxal phosphate-dependent aminotransferase [Paracoccaceae bacterium]|nr:pyridoxal phosphate-dependent aminotransferase [Paracoccaceae bacterium]
MDFDRIVDRRGTHSMKWDMLESQYGIPADDGIAMWVADMDFEPPAAVRNAVRSMLERGIFGYYGDDASYRTAIRGWMERRHGWLIEPDWIFTTHGLVNGTALCVDVFTDPGDGVILFTPVYHAFSRVIRAAGRRIVECELVEQDGRYHMDLDAWDDRMTGRETMAILCSPHNPGGCVWTVEELRDVAAFCARHDLILVSDEIHQDLVFPGHVHVPTAVAAPEVSARLITLTATTKTFNIAGSHTGNVIIADPNLARTFAARLAALGLTPNSFGLFMAEAAYNEGEDWLEALLVYLDENRRLFDTALNAVSGVRSMALEATYLAWVDFTTTGLDSREVVERVENRARIATNHGATFGLGGDGFLRFNFACPRPRLEEALDRLQSAFADVSG